MNVQELNNIFSVDAINLSLKLILGDNIELSIDLDSKNYSVKFDGNTINDSFYTDNFKFIFTSILSNILSVKHGINISRDELEKFINVYNIFYRSNVNTYLKTTGISNVGIKNEQQFKDIMKNYILKCYLNKLNGGKADE